MWVDHEYNYFFIDWVVATEAKVDKMNLSVAWIDFRKAYDVVPHQDMLQAIRAPTLVRHTIGKVMRQWRMGLEVRTAADIAVEQVEFRRGLFQGDSLSPLLFVLTVAPLSSFLRLAGGVQSAHHESAVTHLLFMDDLKVFERSQEDLEATVEGVEGLSAAVGITLGARKCA